MLKHMENHFIQFYFEIFSKLKLPICKGVTPSFVFQFTEALLSISNFTISKNPPCEAKIPFIQNYLKIINELRLPIYKAVAPSSIPSSALAPRVIKNNTVLKCPCSEAKLHLEKMYIVSVI